MKRTQISTSLASLAMIGLISASASAGTLLVDIVSGGDNGGPVASSNADFLAQDAAIEAGASVVVFDADLNNSATGNIVPVSSGSGVNASLQLLSGSGFNQGSGGPRDGVPILDGYAFGSNVAVDVELTGLEEIPTGTDFLLTVYGVGDASDQDADITVTYNAVGVTQGPTSPDGTIGAITSDAYEQFTLTKVAGVDSLSISAFNVDGRFNAMNGFSLTYAVPEPTSLALLCLGAVACATVRRTALADRNQSRD